MNDCIFCRIVAGEIPSQRVYESNGAIAFLDIMQAARGHTLVIPKVHAPSLGDLDDVSVGELFRAVKDVMGKIGRSLQPPAFNVGWNHGLSAGQHVFHLHVHILPRFAPGGTGVQALGDGGDPSQLAKIAEAIRSA